MHWSKKEQALPTRDFPGPQYSTRQSQRVEGFSRAATSKTLMYVNTIRLEPGPFGQFQVIITLEMANII